MALYLEGNDAGSKKIVTPDDSTIELSGVVLQVKNGGITLAKLDANIFDGATDADVDINNDEIIIVDYSDSGNTKTEKISDLITAMGSVFTALPSYTAGETLSGGEALYLKSDGKVWKAKADAAATMPCIGFAAAAAEAEASVYVKGPGMVMASVQGGGALTVGGECWVSAATAGQVTQTAPVGSANVQQSVGRMATASNLHIVLGQGVLYPSA